MCSCQDQQHQAGKDSPVSVGVPASVIVSGGSSGSAPTAHDGLLTETRPGENASPSLGPADMAALVKKVDELVLCPTYLLLALLHIELNCEKPNFYGFGLENKFIFY